MLGFVGGTLLITMSLDHLDSYVSSAVIGVFVFSIALFALRGLDILKIEDELKEEIKELRNMLKDNKGQLSVVGLVMLFITLVVWLKFYPECYNICDDLATQMENNGDTLTAFFVRLIPFFITMTIIASITMYARPIVLGGEG